MVRKGGSAPVRPEIPPNSSDIEPAAIVLMQNCWNEVPELRPEFPEIKKTLRAFNKGKYVRNNYSTLLKHKKINEIFSLTCLFMGIAMVKRLIQKQTLLNVKSS